MASEGLRNFTSIATRRLDKRRQIKLALPPSPLHRLRHCPHTNPLAFSKFSPISLDEATTVTSCEERGWAQKFPTQ
ncbi:MAG: hypothetical protein C4295_07130 [Candidatus Fervidibacterota bacterium]